MDEILWCDYLNETSSALLSHGTFYLVLVLNFEFADDIILCDYSNETSSVYCAVQDGFNVFNLKG